MAVKISDITAALEAFAPLALQESYDNCGLIVGRPETECDGALLTVDVTPATVEEARRRGLNLIVAHHPLIFKGLKRLNGETPVEQAVIAAIRADIAIYACHTCLDNAPGGVSHQMASMLKLSDVSTLDPAADGSGSGAIGSLPQPLAAEDFVRTVKQTFGSPVARCTALPQDRLISRVAMCGGSGSFLIEKAIEAGADAFITSDTKYHDFVDYHNRILLVDIGHHESENSTKQIFYNIISEKFPTFAVEYSQTDTNPIKYL